MVTETKLAFLDVETTGVVPGRDEVIEIATILTDLDLKEIDRFEAKIQFDASKMTPQAAAVNGYRPEDWKDAVPFIKWSAWLERHNPYGQVSIPVGHNVEFDYAMIVERYYKPYGKFLALAYNKIDTRALAVAMRVAKAIDVPNVKLGTVADALGIKYSTAHRAMADAEICKEIFLRVVGVFQS